MMGALVAVIVLSGVAPVLAQDHDMQPSRSGLALFLTWLPMILFLGIMGLFYGYMRRAVSRAKKYEGHMERVEGLLERIAKAVEKE